MQWKDATVLLCYLVCPTHFTHFPPAPHLHRFLLHAPYLYYLFCLHAPYLSPLRPDAPTSPPPLTFMVSSSILLPSPCVSSSFSSIVPYPYARDDVALLCVRHPPAQVGGNVVDHIAGDGMHAPTLLHAPPRRVPAPSPALLAAAAALTSEQPPACHAQHGTARHSTAKHSTEDTEYGIRCNVQGAHRGQTQSASPIVLP
ncbi:unnamed protein product [Closterium sp. NIES-53]